MWKIKFYSWSYTTIEGKRELVKAEVEFKFDNLEETVAFAETVIAHSDVDTFEIRKES